MNERYFYQEQVDTKPAAIPELTPSEMISAIKDGLGLDPLRLSKMFGFEEEISTSSLADKVSEEIIKLYFASFQTLHGLFVPGRLPDIVRRKSELFSGQTALDFIIDGEIEKVSEAYGQTFSFIGDYEKLAPHTLQENK